jgi:uncharacterized protein (DUF488 family)
MEIWTIGHSTRSLDELVSLLTQNNIRILVDVRHYPGSRKNPQFNRDNLSLELPRSNIEYRWLGKELGGFRKGGYLEYMETAEFKQGLVKLLEIAQSGRTVIMCAEIVWFQCHRRWISDQLVREGYNVIHIINEKRTYDHKILEEK